MTRILQITDIHLVSPPQKVSAVLDTYILFEQAIEKILVDLPKVSPVDAIIVTGDISGDGTPESYLDFRHVIERLGIPYFLIPGNHDKQEPLRSCFQDKSMFPEYGELNWVKELAHFSVIGLDTSILNQSAGQLSKATLAFLQTALSYNLDKPALIAMHHPPFRSGNQFMDNIRLEKTHDFEATLKASPREIRVICGHLHNSVVCNIGPATVLSSPAIASTFVTDYRDDAPIGFTQDPGGYMIHEWDNGFRSTFMSLKRHTALNRF